MWKYQPSIKSEFLIKMVLILFVSIGLWCLIWIQGEYSTFKSKSKRLRMEYIDTQKTRLKSEVTRVVNYINAMRRQAEKRLEITLKERVEQAHLIAMNIYEQNTASKDNSEIEKMIKDAFVKYFKPLDWYLGSGEYLGEAKEQIQKEILNLIVNLQFGAEGYFFGSTYNGDSLFSNGKMTFGSGNIWELTDPDGVKIIQEQRKAVDDPQGGFVYYSWNKLDLSVPSPKVSFVLGIPEWKWMIGAGVYLDTIETIIDDNRAELILGFKKRIFRIIMSMAFLVVLIFLWSRFISNKIQKSIEIISLFFEKANRDSIVIDLNDIQLKEFKDIAASTNKMLKERQQAREALIESEDRFRNLSNLTFEGILIHDKGVAKDVNEALIKMFGYQREELIGSNFIDLFIPPDCQAEIKENIVKEYAIPYEVTARKKDGTLFPIEIESKIIENKEAKFRVTAMRDISRRRQMEEGLRESEERFRRIYDHVAVGVAQVSLEFRIIRANNAYCSMLGYGEDELMGRHLRDITSPEIVEENLARQSQLISGEIDHYRLDKQFIHKNGSILHGILDASLVRDSEGKPLYFLGSVLDITRRKQQEERYRKIIASSIDGFWVMDTKGKFLDVNEAYCVISGYSRDELLNMSIMDIETVESPENINKRIRKNIQQGNERFETRHRHKNGKILDVEISTIYTSDNGGMFFVFIRDITDFKIAEKKKLQLETKLRQAQKMESIGTLAGGIAHDFNNILFPIMGYTEMLMEDFPDEGVLRSRLDKIYAGTMRAKELVQQILTFSRQESSELKRMKIQPLIREALKLIRSTIPTTIEINQNIQADCGMIKADPTRIHQIIMNLATNASHAMEKTGGKFKVGLKQVELGESDLLAPGMTPGAYACLSVADTGVGMDKNLAGKIFDPFFTTKEKGRGTGMGLSVVHGIVLTMNGAINVSSEPDKGTEFNIYLPVVKDAAAGRKVRIKEKIQGGDERILLVDDEEGIIAMEKQILDRLGYQVVSRTSSIEALEVLRGAPDKFDLIITDMAMPGMSGDRLAVEVRRLRPGIPILLCTGFSDTMSEEKAALLGVKGFLMKPIAMKVLAQKIREVLGEN